MQIGEYQPARPDEPGAVDLTTLAGEMTRRDGSRYFKPGEQVTRELLIKYGLLPPDVASTFVKPNDLFAHDQFFPGLVSEPGGRTNRKVIQAMVDATAAAGGDSIMIDTSILSKTARICLVDTRGSDLVDLNQFDVSSEGLATTGILPLDDLRFFVDYCHFKGIAANLAGSIQSFQAQQIWVLIPELDQVSTRGGASAYPVDPSASAAGGGSRHERVIKRQLVRGLTAPEHGGVLNIPERWKDNPAARDRVKQTVEMISELRKQQELPSLKVYYVDRFGFPTPFL